MIPLRIRIPLSEVNIDKNDQAVFDLNKYSVDRVISVYLSDHLSDHNLKYTFDEKSRRLILLITLKQLCSLDWTNTLVINHYSVQTERDLKIDELLS